MFFKLLGTAQIVAVLICGLCFSVPQIVAAQNFIPLIPGLSPTPGSMSEYFKALYFLAISIAALIAVGKIILAGIKYTTSGIVPEKQGAKEDIRSALVGLLIILTAVAVLRVINPSLANLPALTPAGDLVRWEVVPDAPTVRTIPCIEISADDGSTLYNCRDAKASCRESEGHDGRVVAGVVECTTTSIDGTDICSSPNGCTRQHCPFFRIRGAFAGCSGWCSSFNNSVYDKNTEVCIYENE